VTCQLNIEQATENKITKVLSGNPLVNEIYTAEPSSKEILYI